MELEFARQKDVPDAYSFVVKGRSQGVVDWEPAIRDLLEDVAGGVSAGVISAKFHNGLIEAIVHGAQEVGEPKVVLSGGCFQNRLLTEQTVASPRQKNFRLYCHQRIPPNDGGIALGQAVATNWRR